MPVIAFSLGAPQPKWVFGETTTTNGVRGDPVIQSVLSTAYVQVSVTATLAGSAYNPTADAIQMAFTVVGTDPVLADWKTGSWTTALATGSYLAQCLIGPGVGGTALTRGTYAVWVKITDSPEIPVQQVGTLQIV